MGGALRYKLEVYHQYFSDKLYGLGVPKQSPSLCNLVRKLPRNMEKVGRCLGGEICIILSLPWWTFRIFFIFSARGRVSVGNLGGGGYIFFFGAEKNPTKLLPGKEKAHKHKQFCPVTAWVRGGSPGRVARGQMSMCCVRNTRNMNIFVRVPGREDR